MAMIILSSAAAWEVFASSRSFSAVLNDIMLKRSQVRRSSDASEARMAKVRLESALSGHGVNRK